MILTGHPAGCARPRGLIDFGWPLITFAALLSCTCANSRRTIAPPDTEVGGVVLVTGSAARAGGSPELHAEARFFAPPHDLAWVRLTTGPAYEEGRVDVLTTWNDEESGYAWVPIDTCVQFSADSTPESAPYLDVGERLELASPAGILVLRRSESVSYVGLERSEFVPSADYSLAGLGTAAIPAFEVPLAAPEALDLISPVEWECDPFPYPEVCDNAKPCEILDVGAPMPVTWRPAAADGDVIVLYEGADRDPWACRFADDGDAVLSAEMLGDHGSLYVYRRRVRTVVVEGLEAVVGIAFEATPTCFPFYYGGS